MKTDLLNRRLRFAPPSPVVSRIVLQEADYLIFEAISRHGPLPSHYLYEHTKHLRKDKSHLQNRLTEFYNGDQEGPYLVRPPQQFAGFEARYQHIVYDLAPRAKTALAEQGRFRKFSPRRSDPFLHQLMGACVASSIELSLSPGARYIPREEILTHPKVGEAKGVKNPMAVPLHGFGVRGTLIPDDLFGIEYADRAGFRFFAVEIDRNTESIERTNLEYNTFGKKVVGYLQMLRERTYRSWWGIPNLSILTITTNATHAENILDHIRKVSDPRYFERFAIATETSFGVNWRVPSTVLSGLLTDPWSTPAGQKDVRKP